MRNCGRGRHPTPEKDGRIRRRSSPSTHTTPSVGDGKDNKSSGANQLSGQFNELVVSPGPRTSIAINIQQLSPVQDKKYLDPQPASTFTNHHHLSTQSTHHMQNNRNLQPPHFSQLSETDIASNSPNDPTIPFDICPVKTGTPKLKPSLLVQNKEKRKFNHSMGGQAPKLLRPGMVLLKNFISCKDQVEVVKICRKLGQGNGGFYQPGYGDGATMHLKMMCLGKNWDPKTSYGEQRREDGAEPPPIPSEFHQLVQRAIQDTHAYLSKEFKQTNVETILPSMTPDICIVNFYTSNGRLGLHKDKDESQQSLNRGLPVVSISIGDSAEFSYGDQMDINKAEKIVLKSGDILIFGGKSRHVYHGVTSILRDTAPQPLLQESDLRPGRLNLTFRKY